ncbi:MAG: DASS family sodium-coupled anion symporter [Hyphomonadaceae bacterium]
MARQVEESEEPAAGGPLIKRAGLLAGLAAAFLIQLFPVPAGLSPEAWIVVSLGALMVIWWVSEAVPVAITALLPLALLPIFGVVEFDQAAAAYADEVLYLFIGGFILGAAVERWRLHERLALSIVVRAGGKPRAMVAGFMIAACLISMWISNTATTLMLAPIAFGAARAFNPDGEADLALGGALLLGVAHAATIGGIGTPVGSPTNLIAVSFFERAGEPMSFLSWSGAALPMLIIMLPIAWALLIIPIRNARPDESERAVVEVKRALETLGGFSKPETRIAIVFGIVAFLWMFRPLLQLAPGFENLSDAGIALVGAVALFLIPAGVGGFQTKLMDWPTAERIPWGIVIMFGGGLALAGAMEATGLTQWIGAAISGMDMATLFALIAALVIATILVSEVASNVATLTSMLPIVAAVAAATGADLRALAFPVAIAASFAFALPVATPPNAIAYATGLVTLRRMLTVGLCLDIAAIIVILTVTRFITPA